MARTQVLDELLSHEFHLIDVDIQSPFLQQAVLWPTAAFSTISAPEITIETDAIAEGTSEYTYTVLKRATASPMVLAKGVSMYNSDFWRWILGGLSGYNDSEGASIGIPVLGEMPLSPGRRRNLLLIQSSGISFKGLLAAIRNGSVREKILGATLMPAAAVTAAASATASLLSSGEADLNLLGVPGRSYMLFDCLPVRYKAAGDFDANSSLVSVEELEISYTRFEVFGAF